MLKVLVLQKYCGLSDEETEFQIMDRFSFLQFLGLQAGDEVPDAPPIVGLQATTAEERVRWHPTAF